MFIECIVSLSIWVIKMLSTESLVAIVSTRYVFCGLSNVATSTLIYLTFEIDDSSITEKFGLFLILFLISSIFPPGIFLTIDWAKLWETDGSWYLENKFFTTVYPNYFIRISADKKVDTRSYPNSILERGQ